MEFKSQLTLQGKLPTGPLVRLSLNTLTKESLSQYSYLLLSYKSGVPRSIRKRLTVRKQRAKRLRKPRIFAQLRIEVVPDDMFASFLEGEHDIRLDSYRTGEQAVYLSYYEKVFGENLAEGTRRANLRATYTTSKANVKEEWHANFKTIPSNKGNIHSYFLHPSAADNLKAFAEAFVASLGFSVVVLRAQNYTLAYKVYTDYAPIRPIPSEIESCFETRGPYLFKLLREEMLLYPWEEVQALCERKVVE